MNFDINQQGKVKNITVQDSSADGIFNKAAVNSVRQWRFAEKDYGKRNQVYKIKFALDDQDVVVR